MINKYVVIVLGGLASFLIAAAGLANDGGMSLADWFYSLGQGVVGTGLTGLSAGTSYRSNRDDLSDAQ